MSFSQPEAFAGMKTASSTLSVDIDKLPYKSSFGNEFATEAVKGALPLGQNSPQKVPFGLYAEQMSGSPFTAPRSSNRCSWLYRIRPSAMHKPYEPMERGLIRSSPFHETPTSPNQLRWDPIPIPKERTDFLSGLVTLAGNGNSEAHSGVAVHVYVANRSMEKRFFYDADGELLIVPQLGALVLHTEFGPVGINPGEICVIPRGVKFRVELADAEAWGYVCENYGAMFRLPELGPIGANGLANARDFQVPCAAYEDLEGEFRVVAKFCGGLWAAVLDHSPLDVVAWHGNLTPYKYELSRFNCINSVSFDHPDPSIYTVLTSPSEIPGTANCDFAIFPPLLIGSGIWPVTAHAAVQARATRQESLGLCVILTVDKPH